MKKKKYMRPQVSVVSLQMEQVIAYSFPEEANMPIKSKRRGDDFYTEESDY